MGSHNLERRVSIGGRDPVTSMFRVPYPCAPRRSGCQKARHDACEPTYMGSPKLSFWIRDNTQSVCPEFVLTSSLIGAFRPALHRVGEL
jgi:hypothetical protein